jgi:hypothetical protein
LVPLQSFGHTAGREPVDASNFSTGPFSSNSPHFDQKLPTSMKSTTATPFNVVWRLEQMDAATKSAPRRIHYLNKVRAES